MICCQGVQHRKKRHAQQWCLIVLFILTALCVVRKEKKANPESNNTNAEEFGLPDPMDLLKLIAYVCY